MKKETVQAEISKLDERIRDAEGALDAMLLGLAGALLGFVCNHILSTTSGDETETLWLAVAAWLSFLSLASGLARTWCQRSLYRASMHFLFSQQVLGVAKRVEDAEEVLEKEFELVLEKELEHISTEKAPGRVEKVISRVVHESHPAGMLNQLMAEAAKQQDRASEHLQQGRFAKWLLLPQVALLLGSALCVAVVVSIAALC